MHLPEYMAVHAGHHFARWTRSSWWFGEVVFGSLAETNWLRLTGLNWTASMSLLRLKKTAKVHGELLPENASFACSKLATSGDLSVD